MERKPHMLLHYGVVLIDVKILPSSMGEEVRCFTQDDGNVLVWSRARQEG